LQVGAFGADAFYWSEYHENSGAPFSTIVKSLLGNPGAALIPSVPGRVERLRVDDTVLYVDAGELRAFTLAGEPLVAPDEATAFPVTNAPPRASADETGLYVDGQQVALPVTTFTVVDDYGVFYVPRTARHNLLFTPFADLRSSTWVTNTPPTTNDFVRIWATPRHVYASSRYFDHAPRAMTYGDRSIIGQ
jgi:hypothetical protein